MKPLSFRVQSHILKLLGDELIGHDRLAVFELVKNSYDAGARQVDVTLALKENPPTIRVLDDGVGMSSSTIENSWLEIGTDFKRGSARVRGPLGRMPLGEKGVGRLAIQKLGNKTRMVTRVENGQEYEFSIDWAALIGGSKYLEPDKLQVSIDQKQPSTDIPTPSGTLIEISQLNNTEWSRREIRDLYRLVSSLNNPFDSAESFKVSLHVPGQEDDLKDLPNLEKMLDAAVWKFDFSIDSITGAVEWTYDFTPPKFKDLKADSKKNVEKLPLVELEDDDFPSENGQPTKKKKNRDRIFLLPSDLDGIGPIKGKIFAFHRRDEILKASGASQQIKKWLEHQTGIRVYREKIRVFNYGEPGEDWLGLDARRINRPTGKLGTQNIIAQVSIDLDASGGLKEKTNREGFDDNETFRRFRRIVQSVFDLFQREHANDREKIDKALKGEYETPPIKQAMENLAKIGRLHNIESEIKPILQSIQTELNTFREVMVSSGIAGMNLVLVFHEIIHNIDRIRGKIDSGAAPDDVRTEVEHLRKLLDTFKPLLQRDPARKVSVTDLVGRSWGLHEERFTRHQVVGSNWASDPEKGHAFTLTIPRGLVVGALSNAIDNAIYWSRYRKERDDSNNAAAVLVLSHWDEDDGGIVAIVDNGPGFQLPIEQIGRAFSTTRVGGMGLGLFYCKTVMDAIDGKVEAITADELRDTIDIPAIYDGAAVVFTFGKKNS